MAGTGCAPSLHGAPGEFPTGYVEVASGVWAWLQANGVWGETNAGLVRGAGEALMVDTLWDERLAERMLRSAVPLLDGAPLTTAVNTHRDGDHWWGNAALPPGVDIWASVLALAEMRVEPPPASLHRLRSLSRRSQILPGPLGRLSRYTAGMLDPFDHTGTPRLPQHSFSGRHALDVGGRRVELLHLGPAHTEGDAVVHLPDDGVLFGGDLLFFGVTPVVWDGPVSHWVTALDRMLELDAQTYVPGHGPLGHRADLELLREYWLWLQDAVSGPLGRGDGRDETIRAAATDPGFARWRSWGCPERLAINVLALHRDHTGIPFPGPAPLHRPWMFAKVADLLRRL